MSLMCVVLDGSADWTWLDRTSPNQSRKTCDSLLKTQDWWHSFCQTSYRISPVLDQRFWLARYNPSHRRICLDGGAEAFEELTAQTPDKEPERIQQYSMKTNILKAWEHKMKPGVKTDGQRDSVGKRIKSRANPPLTALLTAIRKLASPPKRLAIALETGTYAMGITSIGTPFFHCWPRALESFLRGKKKKTEQSFLFPSDGRQNCPFTFFSRWTNKHTPVVGDDNEMFSAAGYDLLLSQAAAVRRREDEREAEITGDKVKSSAASV